VRVERSTIETLTFPTAVLTALRFYWMAGDAQADASTNDGLGDLVRMLQTCLNTHTNAAAGFTVSLSSTNRVTISHASSFRILWGDALTTLNAVPFGFVQSDPVNVSTSTTAVNQTRGAWCPRRVASQDTRDVLTYAIGAAVSLSGRQRVSRHAEARSTRDFEYELLLRRYALTEYADATEPTGTIEAAYQYAMSLGFPIRWYADEASRTSSSYTLYYLRAEELTGSRLDIIDRDPRARFRWFAKLPLRRSS
jgi:hypothetical protein